MEPDPHAFFQPLMLCRPLRRLTALLLLGSAPLLASAQAPVGAAVTTDQVRAELVVHAPSGIAAGQTVWLGLQIRHQPQWHTYWRNPGDSGLPTTLQWTLPQGVQAGDIEWPTPHKLPIGPLTNYGYEGTLLLPVPLTVDAGFDAQTLDVRLRADWLVCKEVCIPESGEFRLRLPTQASTGLEHAAAFEAARAAVPRDLPGARATSRFEGDALKLEVTGLPAAWQGRSIEFFSEAAGVIDHAAKTPAQWAGDRWQVTVPLSAQRSESPARLMSVLVAEGETRGGRLAIDVVGPWPAPPPVPGLDETASTAASPAPMSPAAVAAPVGFGAALLLALVGGLLLNLMPCVFPVLSLKLFGFAAHAHDRRALLSGGLAYTAGVVLSFVALAGRAAGPARRRRAAGLGLPAAVAGFRRGAGSAVHPHRPEPGGCVRVRLGAAQRAWRRCGRAIRRSTPRSPACWRWRWPHPAPRPSWAPRSDWR